MIHILAAFVWVGGALYSQLTAQRILNSRSDEAIKTYIAAVDWAGPHVFGPATAVVLLAGVGLVLWNDAWTFSQPWVYLSLALIVVSGLVGSLVLGPTAGRMSRALDDHGADSTEFRQILARFFGIARIDTLVLLVIVTLMIFKPGA